MQAIVKKQFVQVDGAASSPGAPVRAGGAARCKKNVRMLRADSVVHALEITCSCGETTVVELEYTPETQA